MILRNRKEWGALRPRPPTVKNGVSQVVRKSSDQELTLVMYAVYKGMNNYSQIYRYNNKPLHVSQSGFHGSCH